MADAMFVVDDGLDVLTNRILGAGTEPKYVGWGTGATGAAVDDEGLETAAGESRTEGTGSRQETNTANDTHRVVAAITCASAPKSITEVAVYDASTVGNCYSHGTFTAIAVSVGDSISFTLNHVYNQAA